MLSYSQNGEDVVLDRVFAGQKTGFYVDIGACHPVEDSVTLHFYERGWHGINVEPDAALHALFPPARPRDVNLFLAVGRERGQAQFHPTGTRGHGTLDAGIAAHRTDGQREQPVAMLRLADVIDCYAGPNQRIDFLKIDVEGWEADVVASGDWARHRPRIVVVEATDEQGAATHEGWEPALLAAGYRFGLFDGVNRFYCAGDEADALLPRLQAPANILDGWQRAGDARAHAALSELQGRTEEAERWAAECEARSHALGLDLEEARHEAEQARQQAEAAAAASAQDQHHASELQRLRDEVERLEVEASRARAEAAAALRREDEAEARMSGLEMELVRREGVDPEAQARLENLEREAQALRAAHEQARAAAADSEAWLAAVRASTSWKVTRPVRVGVRALMGRVGRP